MVYLVWIIILSIFNFQIFYDVGRNAGERFILLACLIWKIRIILHKSISRFCFTEHFGTGVCISILVYFYEDIQKMVQLFF